MAQNTATFTLKLKSEGMDGAEKQSKAIRNNLEGAQKAASAMKVAQSAAAQPTGRAGASAGIAGQEVETYNRARGAMGAAGGTARDFADQARGLGGLVRLYATAAANVFAVTAAFNALSRAMDTTNMVKGLDQLGAASGVALGSLSKRLVSATDGAISLREAMEATTKAVSSGMNSDDVLRLGNVAKQASQALGVDMGDAISRLTRGITKLEPELLDELGIFTKLDPAVKEYAKSVNKSVSELSDFERRQAFANAVLAEGEQKFSSIKIDANPYTQLSAAVRDATQSILEFVNKVVAPVASFFSQSPTALIAGIGTIAAVLLKQALPAIGEFKQGLEETAARAGQLAQQKAQEAQQARQLINQKIIDEVEARADKELRAVEAAESKIQQLQQGNLNKRSAAYKLLSKDLQDVQEQDLKRVEAAATKAADKGKTAEAAAYREVVVAIRAQKAAEEELINTRKNLTAQVEKDAESWGTYGQTVKAGRAAQEAATKSAIISNAAYNGSLIGVIGSVKLLREEIAKNNITGFSAAMLTARGAIAAVGGAISTAMNALNGFFMIIATITAAISIIDNIFSKASKEIDAFGSAVTRTEGATKNLTDTFDAIYKINPFSVQSLEAQANSMLEFSTSVSELAKSAEKALRALESSGWDKFKDTIKGILNFDIQSTFTKSLSEGIVAAVKGIDNKAISEELKARLSGILNVKDVTNVEQLEKALKGLKPTSAIVVEVQRALKGASTEAGVAAGKAREFVTAFDASKEAFRELSKQFEVNDATTKWANTSIASLTKLSQNLDGPIAGSIANLVKLSEEIDKAPIFGNSSLAVAQLNTELKNAQQLMVRSEQEAQNLEKALEDLKNKNVLRAAEGLGGVNVSRQQAEKIVGDEIARLNSEIAKARAARAGAESSAEAAATKIRASISSGLTESVDLVSKGIQAALAKGSTQVLQSIYSRIDNIPELAGRQFDLKLKELGIQENSIRTQQELSNRIGLLTAELAVTNANSALQKAEAAAKTTGGGQRAETAASDVRIAQKELEDAAKKLSLLRQAAKDPVGALAALNVELNDAASGAKSYSKEIVDAANRNAGFIKSLNDIAAQQRIIKNLEEPLAKEAAKFKAESDVLDAKLRSNANTREGLQLQLSLNKANEVETLEKLRISQLQQVDLETEKKKLQTQTAYNNSLITGAALAAENKANDAQKVYQAAELAKRESEAAIRAEDRIRREQVENNITKERLAIYDRVQAKLKEIQDSERQNQQIRQNAAISIRDSELSLAETRLNIAEQQGVLSEQFIANARADLELAKQAITAEKERQSLSNQRAAALADLAAKANRQAMSNEDNSATIRQMLELASAFDAQAEAQDRANSARITAIGLTRQQSIETAKQNEELKKQTELLGLFTNISDTLTSAFGKTGQVLGTFVTTLADSVKTQLEYNTSREKLLKIETDYQAKAMSGEEITAEDVNRRAKAEKDLGKLNEKNARDEMVNNTKLVGSVKNMFKEKTAAYKIFNAFERAMHVYTLTMDIAKIASGWMVTSQKVQQDQVQAVSAAGPTGAKAAQDTPGPVWVKIAAGLAAFAFVMSLAKGKPAAGPAPGTSAADRQETQGTGMAWVDGKKVETGGGVFGDPEAKSDGIRKSLERIAETSVDGLSYDNRVVALLTSIDNSIGKAAIGLFGVTGLRTGTAFNTREGTQSGGGFLGTGLFASRTSTQIADSGLIIKGSFQQLAGTIDGAVVQLYEDVLTTKKRWYGKTTSDLNRRTEEIPEALRYINEVFSYSADLFVELGSQLGMGSEEVYAALDSLGSIDFEASLRGLKGEEFENALQSLISNKLSQAASAVFSTIVDEFKKFGEDAIETVTRVLDQSKKVTQALKNIGSTNLDEILSNKVITETRTRFRLFGRTITETTTRSLTEAEIALEKIRIADNLVELAGGLENFLERAEFFREKFLTEAEQLAPIQKAVGEELERLGLAGVVTRDQFKSVVRSLDLTTKSGQETYNSLMLVQEGFYEITKQYEDLIKEVDSINTDSVTKFMTEAEKLIYLRNKERDTILETNKPLFDRITALRLASLELDSATKALLDGYKNVTQIADQARQAILTAARTGLTSLQDAAVALAQKGLTLLQTEADNTKQKILSLAGQGLQTLQTELSTAKDLTLQLATQGLQNLQTQLNEANNAALQLASEGLNVLKSELANANSELTSTATEGLNLLNQKAENLKQQLLSTAREGFSELTSQLNSAQNLVRDLAINGFRVLNENLQTAQQGLQDTKNSIIDGYKTAKEIRQKEVESLRAFSKSIKDFLKELSFSELTAGTQRQKLKMLKEEFSKTLELAKAGDTEAQGKLTIISKDLLSTAKEQAGSKLEYMRTFADVTNRLEGVSIQVDEKLKDEQEVATDKVKTFGDSLQNATIELDKWKKLLIETGTTIQEADSKISQESLVITPESLSKLFKEAQSKINAANTDIANWTQKVGTAAAQAASAVDAKSYGELSVNLGILENRIIGIRAAITSYVEETNKILIKSGISPEDLLEDVPESTLFDSLSTIKQNIGNLSINVQKALTDALKASTPTLNEAQQDALRDSAITISEKIAQFVKDINSVLVTAGLQPDDLLKDVPVLKAEDLKDYQSIKTALSGLTDKISLTINDTLNALAKAEFQPAELDIIKTKIAGLSGEIKTQVTTVNDILKAAGISEKFSLGGITALTVEDLKDIATIRAALRTLQNDITNLLGRIVGILSELGVTPDTSGLTLTTLTSSAVKNDLDRIEKSLTIVNTDIVNYIAKTRDILIAAGISDSEADRALGKVQPITVENISSKLSESASKISTIKTDIENYLTKTRAALSAAGISDSEIDRVLAQAPLITADNISGLLSDSVSKITSIKSDIENYLTKTRSVLIAAGFSDTEVDRALVQAPTITAENIGSLLSESVTKIATVKTDIENYLIKTRAALVSAGFSDTEIDRVLVQTPALSSSEVSDSISNLSTLLKSLKTAITTYITDANSTLSKAGVGTDKLLKLPEEELSGSINEQIGTVKTRLDNLKDNILKYITDTNKVLEQEGFSEADFLVVTLPNDLAPVKTAVENAVDAYHKAIANVQGWATQLSALGISFTPYLPKEDTSLSALTDRFNAANIAFKSANDRINSWINQLTGLADDVQPPAPPAPPALPPILVPDHDEYLNTVIGNRGGGGEGGMRDMEFTPGDANSIEDFLRRVQEAGIPIIRRYAMGGVFDPRNMVKFADGGAFTNSVVSSPTMFSYGQMGEAGPEAIMPLHRDSSGSLGVKAAVGGNSNNQEMVAELRALREEVAKLRQSSERSESYNKKTKETLVRVTRDGEGMVTV